jgi:hypothetical protein
VSGADIAGRYGLFSAPTPVEPERDVTAARSKVGKPRAAVARLAARHRHRERPESRRGRRRELIVLRSRVIPIVALALVATACLGASPPTATQATSYCAPSVPSSAAAYAAAFDGLRHTTSWLSADTAVAVPLPDGRTVWLFGDTFAGTLQTDGTIGPNSRFLDNSFVVQNGACLTPLEGGQPSAPVSLIPEPTAGEAYWPASAVVESGVLRVFCTHVRRTGLGPLDFAIVDMQVATFSLPGLAFQGVQPLPFTTGPTQLYGSTSFVDSDGKAYLYEQNQGNVFVARAPVGQILVPGAWQFWGDPGTGPTWISNQAQSVPMQWTNMPNLIPAPGAGPRSQPWVRRTSTGYLATAKLANAVTDDVSVFTAASPQGPWTYAGQVATTAAAGLIAYNAYTETLPGTATPTVVYSTNLSPFTTPPPLSGQTYGPHFVSPSSLPPG